MFCLSIKPFKLCRRSITGLYVCESSFEAHSWILMIVRPLSVSKNEWNFHQVFKFIIKLLVRYAQSFEGFAHRQPAWSAVGKSFVIIRYKEMLSLSLALLLSLISSLDEVFSVDRLVRRFFCTFVRSCFVINCDYRLVIGQSSELRVFLCYFCGLFGTSIVQSINDGSINQPWLME